MGRIVLGVIVVACLTEISGLFGQESGKRTNEDKYAETEDRFLELHYRIGVLGRLIYNEEVMEELEIVGSQKDAIKKVFDGYTHKFRLIVFDTMEKERLIRSDEAMSQQNKKIALAKAKNERAERTIPLDQKTIEMIEAELLPHQFKRLNQLVVQLHQYQRYGGRFAGLVYLFEQLEVPRDEEIALKKELQEMQKEYNKRLAKLQSKYQAEFVERLPDEIKDRLKQLVGELPTKVKEQ